MPTIEIIQQSAYDILWNCLISTHVGYLICPKFQTCLFSVLTFNVWKGPQFNYFKQGIKFNYFKQGIQFLR